jgi:hypothetical protein
VSLDLPAKKQCRLMQLRRKLVQRESPHVAHQAPKAAKLVILSRKRIDDDGPKLACQSAKFPMTQWVRTISAARTANALSGVHAISVGPADLAAQGP